MRNRLVRLVALLFLTASIARIGAAQVGEPFCMGDSCPCGNDDPTAGCGNDGLDGDPLTGARLSRSAGTTNIFADDLVLTLEGATPNRFGMILIGAQAVQNPLGDGWLCIALGSAGIQRSAPQQTGESGSFSQTRFVAYAEGLATVPIGTGTQLLFQGYYRDGGGPCGSGFNLSNALPVTFTAGPVETELAGRALGLYPYFDFVDVFNQMAPIEATIDPTLFPGIQSLSGQAFVVESRSRIEWDNDSSLIDARGASTPVTFSGGDVSGNVFELDAGTLATPTDSRVSAGYDVVIDFDGDGLLSDGDFIDGRGDEDGLTVFRDPTAPGPYATVEATHDHGGNFERQRIYYPANIAELGELPLIVVSHGNGHNFTWYDHIGEHMASWGYIVMSHQNNTGPGPNAASNTTLKNTDLFLGGLDEIEGGALFGHVDGHRIVLMGHSRGGEGAAIAYHKLFVGTYVGENYGHEDIRLVSSIAPTVFTFFVNPHEVPFQLWTGSADGDVTGAPGDTGAQTYHLLTRAEGQRHSVTYHGVGHGAFHNGNGGLVAAGPCQVARNGTHALMRGLMLPTVRHIVDGEEAAEEFLWRPIQSLKTIGWPASECVDVSYEYWNAPSADAFVIDDFQANPELRLSSSGGQVTIEVDALVEGILQDSNGQLQHDPSDGMNGMTRCSSIDDARGIAFEFSGPASLEFEVVPEARNLTQYTYLSFRACQGTRHPLTTAELADLTFLVTLRDGHGRSSKIRIESTGSGIIEPYQRGTLGAGLGWANEFETTRLRLTDFVSGLPGLDLTDVVAISFDFGRPGQSQVGRLGMDDIELIQK